MKAIVQRQYGTSEVLRLEDVDRPVPSENEILVRVHAAAVNIADWHLMRGIPYGMRAAIGLRKPRHDLPGTDIAGVVEAVGDGATLARPGDAVFGWCQGAFAEFACAPEGNFLKKPERLSFDQAAAVGDSATTALKAVRDQGRIESGHHVLVNGASGGVGTFVVQIAKAYGANVSAVCSTRNADMVRSVGADEIIDYTHEDFTESGRKHDVMVDMVGNRPLSECRQALTRRGTYVLVGVADLGHLLGFGRQVRALAISPFVRQKMRVFVSTHNRDDLETLRALVEAGDVDPVIDRTYDGLPEVPEAIRYQGDGHTRGKIVISIVPA